jgi:hypothetical protein
MSEEADSMKLLKEIRALVYNFQSQKYAPQALHVLELEIKHKHGGFNINYEKATAVWQQFGFGS